MARLAAAQALYQMELTGAGAEAVIREFCDHRFGGDIDGAPMAEADEGFFARLVRGVVAGQAGIDRAIGASLNRRWRLTRLDATVRAILRVGAFELRRPAGATVGAVIDEYIEIARSFFGDGPEPAFVNGVLDRIAQPPATS